MTLLDISLLAESFKSLSIVPLLLMLSSRVFTNSLFMGQASATRVSLPTNTWACLTVYCRCVRKHSISSNRLMSPRSVKCWIPRFNVLFHKECIGYGDSPLGGLLHGFLNSINIGPTKIKPELFIVRGVIIDNMLVGPNNMLVGPNG